MEANQSLDPPAHILDALLPSYQPMLDTIRECWGLWHQSHSVLRQTLQHYRPRNRAIGSDMSDILRATFKEKCESGQLPNISFVEKEKLWFLIIKNAYVVRFNIMDDEGMTVRTHTQNSRKYRDGQLEIEGFEDLEYLYGGYILDQSKSEIQKIYILKRNENEVPVWLIDHHHNVVTQPEFSFQNPARITKQDDEKKRPKRASLKKKLGNDTQSDQPLTGTNDV